MMQTQELKLTRRWDKTFPKSDKVRPFDKLGAFYAQYLR